MKKLSHIFLVAFLLVGVFACEEEDFTGYSGMTPTNPTISFEMPEAATVNEADEETLYVTLKMSEPQVVDVAVHISEAEGSTATWGDDFNIASMVMIPRGRTEVQVPLQIFADCDVEETETIALTVGDQRTANANITPQTFTVDVTHSASTILGTHFEWGGEYFDPETGEEVDPTDLVDFDFYIYDAEGNFVDAFGGVSFESYDFDAEAYEDGTYYLYALVYEVLVRPSDFVIDFPITSSFERCGAFGEVILEQEADFIVDSTIPDYANDGEVVFIPIAVISKSGNEFVVSDVNEEEVVRGKALEESAQIQLK